MNKSQFIKNFLIFFLPLTGLLFLVSASLYFKELSAQKTIILSQEEVSLEKQQELLKSKVQTIISDLQILASHHEFHPDVHQHSTEKLEAITEEFFNFSRFKKVYDQVRLIDKSGQEMVRINFNDGSPSIAKKLQFKGERYYFKDTVKLNKGEFFISPFDLNIENGVIEKPFKPMLRIGTPLFSEKNDAIGVVLVNYHGRELLDTIERMSGKSGGRPMLVNSDGFWLKGLRPEHEWGFMIQDRRDKTFGNLFPQAWPQIFTNTTGQFETSAGLFTFETIYPLIDTSLSSSGSALATGSSTHNITGNNYYWKLVSFINDEELHAANIHLGQTYFYITLAIALLITLGSALVSFLRSKREQMDFALQEARSNIENIFNSSIPLCVTDREHNIIMSNELYDSLFCTPKKKSSNQKCHDTDLCDSCHTDKCPVELIFNQGKEKAICETTLIAPNNQKMHFIITNKPFNNSKGELVGILASFQDITDLKKLESEYAKTRNLESLGVVAGGIAHDFNNLLTAISGYIMLAKNLLDPASKAAELLAESEKASLRAKKLTQRILTFSRGGTPFKKPTFIANFLVDAVKISISEDQYTCQYEIPADLPQVDIDEGQILQVITSIIANAKEAMPDGGSIKTTARTYHHTEQQNHLIAALPPGDYIQILFEDHGTGISENELPKIFDPYYSSKKLGAQKGTGLGLSTAYSIINKHGGTIKVTSEEGQGTTVHMYLPVAGMMDQPHPERPGTPINEWKILVMDDEILIREIAKEIMVQNKWVGEFAEEGAQAVSLYKKAMDSGNPFNLVILDLSVPGGIGGLETLQQLRQIDPKVKSIASSGYADDPIMRSFEEHGFSAAVPKPYSPKKLSTIISKTITG